MRRATSASMIAAGDVLTYVPGRTTDHPSQRASGAYARGAVMLRELHALTAGHPLAAGRECVLHGDPGPFNAIFRGRDAGRLHRLQSLLAALR